MIEESRIHSPQLTFYRHLFAFLFLLFVGAHFLCHPYLAGWSNYTTFLDLLSYQPKHSSYKGLTFSSVLEEDTYNAFEGIVLLNNQARHKIEMRSDISPRPPYRVACLIRKQEKYCSGFIIYFAATDMGKYYLLYNSCPQPNFGRKNVVESGIFLESGLKHEKIIDLSEVAGTSKADSTLLVEIECRRDFFEVKVDSMSFKLSAQEPIQKGLLKIDSSPLVENIFIDRVEVEEIMPDGTARTVAVGVFHMAPIFLDLPLWLGIGPDSRAFRLLAFALLAAVAFLFDELLALVLKRRKISSMSLSGIFLLLLPLQGVLLFILRASLALPFICTLLCVCMLAVAKFILVARYGFIMPVEVWEGQKYRVVLLIFGVLLYVAVALGAVYAQVSEYSLSEPLVLCIIIGPLFILAGGVLSSYSYPRSALFASVLQYFIYFILKLFYVGPGKVVFLGMVLFPWMLGTSVHVIKRQRRSALLSHAVICVLFVVFLGCVEYWIRGNPRLNSYLDYKNCALWIWCDVERLPSLFKDRAVKEILDFEGNHHFREKPTGLYRIVCMGSSSTEGMGSSDRSQFSYAAQLERILKDKVPGDIEVINAGIGGAPFYMIKVNFEEILVPMDPDLLIIYFGGNSDNIVSRIWYDRMRSEVAAAPFIQSKEELWAAMRLRWNPPWMIRGFLRLARFRTFMAVLSTFERLAGSWVSEPGLLLFFNSKVDYGNTLRQSAEEEIVELCVKHGIKVVLIPEVTIPDILKGRGTFHDYYNIFKTVAERWAGKGVYYKDIMDDFGPEVAYSYLLDDVHMNDQGYHYLAEQMAGYLIEEGIISSN